MERTGEKMEKLEIRRMTAADVPAVAEIEKRVFTDAWSECIFEEALMFPNQIFFVLTEDGRLVGYCGLMTVLDEGQIMNIAVEEDCRRKGYGRLLIKEMLKYGEQHGISLYTLEVRESNAAARKMYEGFGFRETGRRKNYYTEPVETAVLMDLSVADGN